MLLKNKALILFVLFFALLFPSAVSSQNSSSVSPSRNDFKFTLLSLGSGSTRITYERAFSQLNSAEFTVGLIGLGWDWMNNSHPHGLLTKLAYKWLLIPINNVSSWLAGFYAKPEFVFADFMYDYKYASSDTKCPDRTYQMALLAECGYQLVLKWFLFDVYTGLGPSFGTGNSNNYFHSFMLFPSDGWLAFTAGFRVGVAF